MQTIDADNDLANVHAGGGNRRHIRIIPMRKPDRKAQIAYRRKIPRMNINEATLTEITRRLVSAYQPEQVILFGSQAWGKPDADSDIDLLVVVSDSEEPAYRRARTGYRSLFGLGVPCDVWVRTREEVSRKASLVTTLTHKILRDGRVLHG